MTDESEVNAVRFSNYIPNVETESTFTGSLIAPVPPAIGTIETSVDGGKTWVDVDASWDPEKGTLDAHRQQAFAKVKQPGFGDIGKVKSDGE